MVARAHGHRSGRRRHRLRHQLDPPARGRRRPGRPLERLMRITRLGQGVDATGRLAPDAIERCLTVLAEFRGVMDGLGVGRGRLVATSAARDAVQRRRVPRRRRRVDGLVPELLTGLEEGRLSMAGAVADLDPADGPFLVLDIGGGSTELVAGDGPDDPALAAVSLQLGCVRVTERFLAARPPDPGGTRRGRGRGGRPAGDGGRRPPPLPGRPPPGRPGRHRHAPWPRSSWGWSSTTVTASTTSC